jgi:aminoglycoside phosphotransferase (APT) family kinase protein
MVTNDERGTALAELRARTALRDAGLDPSAPLVRASSVTNEVWLTPTHVVRVNRTHDSRLAREALVADALPESVGYPHIVAHGQHNLDDWLVCQRVPGTPLAHHWPDLTHDERRSATRQLARRLAALHATEAPGNLPPVIGTPQLLEVGSPDPTPAVIAALEQAGRLEHVDPIVIQEAAELVEEIGDALQPFTARTLVHGDVTFENVLWHDGEVTALLDVEWARPGPSDLDLDIVLRCCAYPQLHVAERFEARTRPEDYAEVPWWLAEDYPALFAYPRQIDRMRVYSIAYDVRDLLANPPPADIKDLSPLHPYHRLARVVQRRSYLDDFASGRGPLRTPPRRGRGSSR